MELAMASGQPAKGRWIGPAAGALFFLLAGLGVVWFAKAIAGVTSSAVLSVLVIIPALLYVILRGDLAELRGPGGWAATFRITNASVTFAAQKFDITTAVQIIEKGTIDELNRLTSKFAGDQPVLMTVSMSEHYDIQAMGTYVQVLSTWPSFKLVAFLDESQCFIGCASPSGFYSIIRNPLLGYEFLRAVQNSNQSELFRYPGVLRNVISTGATNAEALEIMDQNGLEALAVVDEDRHVKGVVERDQLMSKLILSLVKDATGGR
jgi:hypothetical protein